MLVYFADVVRQNITLAKVAKTVKKLPGSKARRDAEGPGHGGAFLKKPVEWQTGGWFPFGPSHSSQQPG